MEQIDQSFWRKACFLIDSLNLWTARVFGYTSVVMMLLVSYEVFCRYVLNSPTDWSGEVNQYLLCLMSMFGGGYALLIDQHVRVDIVYRYFSPKRRSAVELATWWLVVLFALTLLWFGGEVALEALMEGKKSMSLMEMPLFPSLFMVPIGALLILLQALARMARCILTLKTGLEEVNRDKSFA